MNLFSTIIVCLKIASQKFYKEYIDPDATRTTCEIIIAKGYPCEIHEVTTEDGYILEMHRIPYGKNENKSNSSEKPSALLQHGLEGSSSNWVSDMESQSLGFIAADAGIDVWLGNVRGNNYSSKHVSKMQSEPSYWNFTFNEMAKYDLPAMVTYILNVTNREHLYYIGHSQGTMIGFIQFSEEPEWSRTKIRQFHALAPVAWLYHSISKIRQFSPLLSLPEYQSKLYTKADLPVTSISMKDIANMDYKNISRVSVYDGQARSRHGTSILNILHFSQLMTNNKFQKLGKDAPEYHPITSVVPTYLYWSKNDEFTQAEDFAVLKANLKNIAHEHQQHNYDHNDFIMALRAAKDIYPKLIGFIKTDSLNERN